EAQEDGIAGARALDRVEWPGAPVRGQAERRHRRRPDRPEGVDQIPLDVVRQLEQGPARPLRGDALGVEGRELPLDLVGDGEVEVGRLPGGAMAQDRAGLAGVVVAVVVEEHDAAADLRLQPPRRPDLGHEEAPREEPARLLAEGDHRLVAHAARLASLGVRGPTAAWSARLPAMQMAHPITLYQRYPRFDDRYMAMTTTCAITAAAKTAWPPTRRKKKATRKIPRMTP